MVAISGFAFTKPEVMSFIAVAAYNLNSSGDRMDPQTYAIGMKEKIRSLRQFNVRSIITY